MRGTLTIVEPDDIEARVEALEIHVSELDRRVRASEQDAAAARVLAGVADRDVTDIRGELRDFRRATTASFNALRTEMNERFAQVDERFRRVDERFDQVDNGFTEMRGKLDAAAAGQQQIVDILQRLIADRG